MTLKCIAGIETPDEGHISVNGRTLFDSAGRINLPPQARRVGYLFQNYALFPRMTVLQNIAAGLSGREGGADKRRKALAWIGQFGLAGLEDRRPALLSGGQQQRAALARMLIGEPEALLLDEPFSALDTNLREQMQLYMLELLENRRDTILVTHSRDEVFKLCGELVTMDQGRVLRQGETRELFRDPGLVAVARLTGCKNISPLKRTGEREIVALDWGLTLRTLAPVGEGVSHVGIRALDFRPAGPDEGAGGNLVRIKPLSRSREPFEEVVLFRNADSHTDSYTDNHAESHAGDRGVAGPAAPPGPQDSGPGVIWWKYSIYLPYRDVEYLYVPPESLLLLR
jgi:molybdate transport system ATP-binding protein